MDLMGNKKKLEIARDDSVTFDLTPIPVFLVSPYPELFKTMLSYRLMRKDLRAAVVMQKQDIGFVNHFNEEARFELEIQYPQNTTTGQDWLVMNKKFSAELLPQKQYTHTLELSPSSLSPIGEVPVFTDMVINMKKKQHHVNIYREDQIKSDVEIDVRFHKEENGLRMTVYLKLDASASAPGSFITTARFADGEVLEIFFKDAKPGENAIQSLNVINGSKYLGQKVDIETREYIGQRCINKSFTISLSY